MSLVNFSRSLLRLDGTPIQEVVGKDEKGEPVRGDMTVRSFVSGVLQAPMQGDEKLSAKERENHFDLLLRVHSAPVLDLSAEEVTLIKNRIARSAYNNLVVGQMLKILEGKDTGLVACSPTDNVEVEDVNESENKEVAG